MVRKDKSSVFKKIPNEVVKGKRRIACLKLTVIVKKKVVHM